VKNEVTTRLRAQAVECCDIRIQKNSHPGETNAFTKLVTSKYS